MPHKGGGGDKSAQFWDAIRSQNQKTLHWCLNYGGVSHATRDDDGYTGRFIFYLWRLCGTP